MALHGTLDTLRHDIVARAERFEQQDKHPARKVLGVPLNAMPTAKPAEASIARNDVVLMPSTPTIIMTRNTQTTIRRILRIKELSEGSSPRFSNMRFRSPSAFRMSQRPRYE